MLTGKNVAVFEVEVKGLRHGDLDFLPHKPGREDAGNGLEADLLPSVVEQPGGVTPETAGAISAHFRLAAIGIVVAESEIRSALAWFDRQQAIGPHPTVTIADRGDLLLAELDRKVTIVDHDEVVSGSVHLTEGEAHGVFDSSGRRYVR